FFLAAGPSLDLPFTLDGLDNTIIGFGKHQFDGPAALGIAIGDARIMLPHPGLDRLSGEAGIIGTIRAAEHVDNRLHVAPPRRRCAETHAVARAGERRPRGSRLRCAPLLTMRAYRSIVPGVSAENTAPPKPSW